jgi:BirA family biotin operon repressor/biotin-[acetyl-CoA-carboxylase] ligase
MTTKEHLLLYLKEKRGEWISGEMISNRLGVSRSAIWKHIRTLREEGYIIESSSKKGYLLSLLSNRLFTDEIPSGLETKIFGKQGIHYFKEIDSTNSRAKELAADGAPEGTLVIAEEQTHGRGRKGRSWFSPPGGAIYVSLILRPTIPPSEAPTITLLTGVAVAEALRSLMPLEALIKWPNDILINNKKLAGILTEISTEMDAIDYVVVGIGINVNIPLESFPKEIREIATSILIEKGNHFPRIDIIRAILYSFERYYELSKQSGFEPIIQKWKTLSDMIGRQATVDVMGRQYTGRVHEIENDGILILKDEQGTLHRIFSGDVKLNGFN